MRSDTWAAFAATIAALAVFGCASVDNPADLERATAEAMRSSFRDQGQATTDRLTQADAVDRACSTADAEGKPLDEKTAQALEQAQLASVPKPTDGRYLGDWKEGEKIAQSGRGLTWSDKAGESNGGNCYNCHQMAKQEISFGTLGPSLYHYGKLRGVADPASAGARPVVEYTWGKVWNAKAYNACSSMPRFGHAGILTEQQVRDVMALLLDPQSPVNR
ncbi:MAG: sulfur oxidation c-type cytochrome SoxX [Pseudomonadota bacterium]